MKKNKIHLLSNTIIITALISILLSGWVMFQQNQVRAEEDGTLRQQCPDKTWVTCKGERCRSINEESDNPGCECDGKAVRCNDKKKNTNTNTDKKNNNKVSNANSKDDNT